MITREAFYKSKRWIKFLEELKLERVSEDGSLKCSVCGAPILKKYDCIGHHTIELTDENVSDFDISLNPDNVELIHHACHNRLHGRFEGFSQSVWLVWGSPCSGKSTWVQDVAFDDDLIVDIDSLWEAVCVSDKFSKPARLKANVFGLRDCLIDQIRTRTGMWRNAYLIGGYPLKTDRDRLCDLLGATEIFIDTPKDVCLKRAKTEEWKEYIEDWFATFSV